MTVLENLRKKLRERLNETSDVISGGGCDDFASYKFYCGMIQAYAVAERDLLDLVEASRHGEDD